MKMRCAGSLFVLGFLLVFPLMCEGQAAGNSPVVVPAGTQVDAITYEGDDAQSVTLKPAEQVALLFAYASWTLEEQCADADSGLGRLCALDELIRGVKGKNGNLIGFNESPLRDTNYRYTLERVGDTCLILASPRVKSLGGFAILGSPGGFSNPHFYYNPNGANMAEAKKLGSVGYSGRGFRR